jgi:hypothetical protein
MLIFELVKTVGNKNILHRVINFVDPLKAKDKEPSPYPYFWQLAVTLLLLLLFVRSLIPLDHFLALLHSVFLRSRRIRSFENFLTTPPGIEAGTTLVA